MRQIQGLVFAGTLDKGYALDIEERRALVHVSYVLNVCVGERAFDAVYRRCEFGRHLVHVGRVIAEHDFARKIADDGYVESIVFAKRQGSVVLKKDPTLFRRLFGFCDMLVGFDHVGVDVLIRSSVVEFAGLESL